MRQRHWERISSETGLNVPGTEESTSTEPSTNTEEEVQVTSVFSLETLVETGAFETHTQDKMFKVRIARFTKSHDCFKPLCDYTAVIKMKYITYITTRLFAHTVRLKTDPFLFQIQT